MDMVDTSKTTFICRRLAGRVAIVTGGGHGLGKAYAQRLAEEGAHVIAADIDEAAAAEVARGLEEMTGVSALGLGVDVSKAASLDAMAKMVVERFGRIDILVNNAAIFATIPISRVPFDELSESEWDKTIEVNLKGVWLAACAVVGEMRKNNYGKIINIASGTAFKGTGGRIHYIASKAGVLGLTKTLANELGAHNITVNCVAPGSTLSEDKPDAETMKRREGRVSSRPLARVQVPSDLVGAIAFFASPDSDFITGQTLVVDGGVYMH